MKKYIPYVYMGRSWPGPSKEAASRERESSVQGEVASLQPQEKRNPTSPPPPPPPPPRRSPTQSAMADDHAAAADLVDGGRPEVIPSAPSSLVCLSCVGGFPSVRRAFGGREALGGLSIDLCVARAAAHEGP